jgi:hypothetical protein
LRAAARFSLGSASSDIELMLHLLSYRRHDRADGPPLQEVRVNGGRIREAEFGRRNSRKVRSAADWRFRPEMRRHGIVSGIIIPPNFRPAPAVLDCEKILLR